IRHTRFSRDWSSDVCSSALRQQLWRSFDQRGFMGLQQAPARALVVALRAAARQQGQQRPDIETGPSEARLPPVDDRKAILTQDQILAAQIQMTDAGGVAPDPDRKSTRLNSSHVKISYAVFC